MSYGFQESIYNIVPPKFYPQEKPVMYRSKHSGTIGPTATTFIQSGTTHPMVANIQGAGDEKVVRDKSHSGFGRVPGSMKNDPTVYMKKFAKSCSVPSLAEVKKSNPEQLMPTHLGSKMKSGVPKRSEQPVCNLVSSKNFIVANAVETILAAPKKVSTGAKDYLKKEDYGKVPKYLAHIKRDIDAEYDYIRQMQQEQDEMNASAQRPLEESERVQLINDLKAKWEAVNTKYQGNTHLTVLDTMGKMTSKEKHEAELAQIEKDIEKLSKRSIQVDMTQ